MADSVSAGHTFTDSTVSVIVPTYNRAALVGAAIESVMRQTYRNIEIVVVDDASTDDTAHVVQSVADDRVRYLRHERNRGGSAARNTGIDNARGELIAFQDSDDEWLPDKLRTQLDALHNAGDKTAIVYCRMQWFNAGVPGKIVGEPFDKERLLLHNYIGTPAILAHRECLRAERFDDALPRRQDWELCIRLAQRYPFIYVDDILVHCRVSPGSITSSDRALLEAYRYILERHGTLIRQNPRALAEFYYMIGSLEARSDQWPDGRAHLVRSALRSPRNGKYWAKALLSLLGQRVYRRAHGIRSAR